MDMRKVAKNLYDNGMRCNCDLDNWEPEQSTGHSCVCRIHKTVMAAEYRPYTLSPEMRIKIASYQ